MTATRDVAPRLATAHPFEVAGLGTAPFRLLGVERRVGPIRYPDGTEYGAPGQPMGSCDFCGTGIADCFVIQSADGKRFVVGCDCVKRTYKQVGTNLPVDVRVAISEVARQKREAKAALKRDALLVRVRAARQTLDAHPWLFTSKPHPNAYIASQGKTLRDYYEWLLNHGFGEGRTRAVEAIERENGQ